MSELTHDDLNEIKSVFFQSVAEDLPEGASVGEVYTEEDLNLKLSCCVHVWLAEHDRDHSTAEVRRVITALLHNNPDILTLQ